MTPHEPPTSPLGLPLESPIPPDIDILLLACRPVDISGLPLSDQYDLTEIVTIEHMRITCECCERPCWIGPRQQAAWAAHRDRAQRLCYWCVFATARANGVSGADLSVISLGGGDAPKRGV